jgi:hypothetical protein
MAYIIFTLVLLVVVTLLFLNSAVFGRKANTSAFTDLSNFFDNAFQNRSPTPMMTEDGSYWKIMKQMLNKPKDVDPFGVISVIKTDLKLIAHYK